MTLCETAPAMVRKIAGSQLEPAIQAILQMMTDIDEEDDWATSDELADDDNDSNAVVAESALDRLACGLGGKTVFPHILNAIPRMMQLPDWKCRHAALMAISAAGEGCHKQMESYLPQIMEAVMNFVNDPVRDSKARVPKSGQSLGCALTDSDSMNAIGCGAATIHQG